MLRSLFVRLWNDEDGGVLATEYLMLGTIVAAGGTAGLVEMRDTMNGEMREYGQSVRDIRRSYMPQPAHGVRPPTRPAADSGVVIDGPVVGLPAGERLPQTSHPTFSAP